MLPKGLGGRRWQLRREHGIGIGVDGGTVSAFSTDEQLGSRLKLGYRRRAIRMYLTVGVCNPLCKTIN